MSQVTYPLAKPKNETDQQYAEQLIRSILHRCPKRRAGSRDELRSQRMMRSELEKYGGQSEFHHFRFNNNLYAVIALHFGLLALASVVALAGFFKIALLLHAGVAIAYVADSARFCYLLRRLFPFRPSQNLLVKFPAEGKPKQRLVFVAHADAALTGWQFHPRIVSGASEQRYWRPFRLLRKPVLIAILCAAWMCCVDSYVIATGNFIPRFYFGYSIIGFYFLIIFGLNLQVAIRQQVVPGANDNLSGCTVLALLARRMDQWKPSDTEVVLVVTGSEEAGTGGSMMLAADMRKEWPTENTIVVSVDSVGQGELRLLQDGEVIPAVLSPKLLKIAQQAGSFDPRFGELKIFTNPAGGTDSLPFWRYGYRYLSLVRIVPELGTPGNYHRASDDAENLDYDQVVDTATYCERLGNALANQSPGWQVSTPIAHPSRVDRPRKAVGG